MEKPITIIVKALKEEGYTVENLGGVIYADDDAKGEGYAINVESTTRKGKKR